MLTNIKILTKILLAVGLLAFVAVCAALFAGMEIKVVGKGYNDLIDNDSKGSIGGLCL